MPLRCPPPAWRTTVRPVVSIPAYDRLWPLFRQPRAGDSGSGRSLSGRRRIVWQDYRRADVKAADRPKSATPGRPAPVASSVSPDRARARPALDPLPEIVSRSSWQRSQQPGTSARKTQSIRSNTNAVADFAFNWRESLRRCNSRRTQHLRREPAPPLSLLRYRRSRFIRSKSQLFRSSTLRMVRECRGKINRLGQPARPVAGTVSCCLYPRPLGAPRRAARAGNPSPSACTVLLFAARDRAASPGSPDPSCPSAKPRPAPRATLWPGGRRAPASCPHSSRPAAASRP